MSRAIVAIFALLILAIGGVYALEGALATAGDDEEVTGESWTPNAGSVTQLDNSNLEGAYYDDVVTVRDNNGNVMSRGDDYEWFDRNGTVKAVVGGGLDGESNAEIDYTWKQTTPEQRGLTTMLGNVPAVIGWVFPAVVFIIAMKFLTG